MISSLTHESVGEPVGGAIPLELRKAQMSDIAPLLTLINGYAGKGIMLPRTEFEISENIRDFPWRMPVKSWRVGALHLYADLGGVRSSVDESLNRRRRPPDRRNVSGRAQAYGWTQCSPLLMADFPPDKFDEVDAAMPLKAWKDVCVVPSFNADEVNGARVAPHIWSRHARPRGPRRCPHLRDTSRPLLPKIRKISSLSWPFSPDGRRSPPLKWV
jgi:amino-acid N-acetyltransferase